LGDPLLAPLRETVAIADRARQPAWARPRKHGQCRALFDSELRLPYKEDNVLHWIDRGGIGSVLTGDPRWIAAQGSLDGYVQNRRGDGFQQLH
jgi:hypothetical protein